VSSEEGLGKEEQLMLSDAQTSGGLLAAVSGESAEGLLDALRSAGVKSAAMIGRIESGEPGRITVSRNR
jgi:selenide, water dikinase